MNVLPMPTGAATRHPQVRIVIGVRRARILNRFNALMRVRAGAAARREVGGAAIARSGNMSARPHCFLLSTGRVLLIRAFAPTDGSGAAPSCTEIARKAHRMPCRHRASLFGDVPAIRVSPLVGRAIFGWRATFPPAPKFWGPECGLRVQ